MEREHAAAEIDRLLEEGRVLFEQGHNDQAIAVWYEVLHLEPNEPRAIECLRAAGAADEEPSGAESPIRVHLEQLLAERKYEEALDYLHEARWQAPDAPEISRGIRLLKERLLRRYLHRIGNLDAIPVVQPGVDEDTPGLSEEERSILRLVDGITSFGDIAHESRLGRFETYRALSRFLNDGIVSAREPAPLNALPPASSGPVASISAPSAPVSAPPDEAAPEIVDDDRTESIAASEAGAGPERGPSRSRGALIAGVAALGLAGAVVVFLLIQGRGSGPKPEMAVAPPSERPEIATAPRPLAPVGPEREIAPAQAEPEIVPEEVAPTEVPATEETPSEPATAREEPAKEEPARGEPAKEEPPRARETATRETRPPKKPEPPPRKAHGTATAPVTTAAAAPKPATTPAEKSPGEKPTPEQSTAETTADKPIAEPAPAPSTAALPAPAPAAPAPTPPAKPKPTGPLEADVAIGAMDVTGPLPRGVVDRAIGRMRDDARACYASAARRAGENAAGKVTVWLTIDESGSARDVSTSGFPLEGVSACLREAAQQVRSRQAPDVGVAGVTFTVTFTPRTH